MGCGPKEQTIMRDPRFPSKRPGPDGETIPAEQCALFLKKLTSSDFFGECTFRAKGGRIYNVTITQSLSAETLKKLS